VFDANSAQTLTVLKRPVFCPGVIEDSRKTMRLSIFFARLGYLLAEDHAEHDDEHEITSCQALLEQQNVLLGHYSRTLLDQSGIQIRIANSLYCEKLRKRSEFASLRRILQSVRFAFASQ